MAALLENPLSIKLYRKKEERAKASSSTTPQNGTGSKATSNPSSLNSTRAHSRMPSSQSSTTSPTNGALKFKKSFNHMLSKAMEAFKIEGRTEEESVSSDPAHFSPTSESFTVYFGSHVRNMYNLRIEEFMSDMANEFDPAHQLGWRASTASTLYSENLSGLIVLLDKSEFSRYAQGLSANRGRQYTCL